MATIDDTWQLIGGQHQAWFDADSLTASATLVGHICELEGVRIDARPSGVLVELPSGTGEAANAVSAVANALGLKANPTRLVQYRVVIESQNPLALNEFWCAATGYRPDSGGLGDPLDRCPALEFRGSADRRSHRNRVHLDVVRSGVLDAGLGEPSGPYGVRYCDADGNEADVLSGDVLAKTVDWQEIWAAVAQYRTVSAAMTADVVAAIAQVADDSGFPLTISVRHDLVIVDTGKDQWDSDAHGLDVEFAELANTVSEAVRAVGATAEMSPVRLVQVFFDAVDIVAVRAFWVAALGYVEDRRSQVTDIFDPQRIGPVLAFQPLDPADTERITQRNRLFVELTVPAQSARRRVESAVAAGGKVLDQTHDSWQIADPEGNELRIVASSQQ